MDTALLAAREACRDLMLRYCRCVDEADHAGVGALFGDDGVLEIAGRRLVGAQQVQGFFAQRPPSLSLHLAGNLLVDVDLAGGHAVGSSQVSVWRTPGSPAELPRPQPVGHPVALARYDDRFVRRPDGQWRFGHRVTVPVFAAA
jgi:hypothetical protein